MVPTPWGDSEELRDRKLRPGPGVPRKEVERSQRERLFGATVAATTIKGYANTSVADLLEISGVSRRTFYRHFADKEDCFVATLDEILTAAAAVTTSQLRSEGTWEERTRGALRSFVKLLIAQPAAARLCLVEIYGAGPRAVERVNEAMRGFEALAQRAFEEVPERRGMPMELIRALISGFRKIVHTHLYRGTEQELKDLIEDLVELGLSYRPPPLPLRPPRRPPVPPAVISLPADPGERLIQATMSVVASKGYAAAKVADIAASAGMSLSTFYAHFDDKETAFEAVLYSGRARLLGMALPVYRRARSWPEGIRAVTEATLTYLEAEPDFARLITVDVYAAGAPALERRDRAIEATQRLIDQGAAEYAPEMKPHTSEAIADTLYAMLCDHVQERGTEGLRTIAPLATYIATSPLIGPERACEVANGGSARRAAR